MAYFPHIVEILCVCVCQNGATNTKRLESSTCPSFPDKASSLQRTVLQAYTASSFHLASITTIQDSGLSFGIVINIWNSGFAPRGGTENNVGGHFKAQTLRLQCWRFCCLVGAQKMHILWVFHSFFWCMIRLEKHSSPTSLQLLTELF